MGYQNRSTGCPIMNGTVRILLFSLINFDFYHHQRNEVKEFGRQQMRWSTIRTLPLTFTRHVTKSIVHASVSTRQNGFFFFFRVPSLHLARFFLLLLNRFVWIKGNACAKWHTKDSRLSGFVFFNPYYHWTKENVINWLMCIFPAAVRRRQSKERIFWKAGERSKIVQMKCTYKTTYYISPRQF